MSCGLVLLGRDPRVCHQQGEGGQLGLGFLFPHFALAGHEIINDIFCALLSITKNDCLNTKPEAKKVTIEHM